MKKIIMITPFKGPLNGVKVLSKQIADRFLELENYKIKLIDTAQAKTPEDFGKFNLKKFKELATLYRELRNIEADDYVYMNFSPRGFAFYRDYLMLFYVLYKTQNVTIHLHANGLEKKRKYFSGKRFSKIRCIVITQNQLQKLTFFNDRFLLPNALMDYYNGNFEIEKEKRKTKVLFFSNLSKSKGTQALYEFCSYCTEYNKDVEITICGGVLDVFSQNKIEQIKALHNKNIHILDPITDPDQKMKLFEKNHFLLFLSKPFYEVYPLVYIEALMSGLSVITTPQYVSPEVISGNTGVLFTTSEAAIRFIENNKNDLTALCMANRIKFEQFYDFENYFIKLKKFILNAD